MLGQGQLTVCENRSTIADSDCLKIHLNWSDVSYYQSERIVYYGAVNTTFLPGQYESVSDDQVALCLDTNEGDQSEPSLMWIIESYVSTILTCISLLAMALTMTTYALFSELRNLPGMAIFNLTLSTFLFHLTFIIGMRQSVYELSDWCMAAAIVIHYAGLASFLWTNAIAWDLYVTFSRRLSAAPRSKCKMLPRYAAYAYGLPLLIVATSVAIDCTDCGFDVGYGRIICWMSNPLANFLFFGLPLIVSLLANFGLFAATIAGIRRVSGSMRSCERHSRKQTPLGQVMLYARMCTVLGFTWVFGLLSTCLAMYPLSALIFACLFILMHALGGLFIFVAFICNRRVAVLYARLWARLTHAKDSHYASQSCNNRSHDQLKTISVETLDRELPLQSPPPTDPGHF